MNNKFSLAHKIALVTGASGGLGQHFAITLGRAGAKVVLAGRRSEALRKLVGSLADEGIAAHAVATDVTDASAIRACFQEAEDLFGIPDVIVCAAGCTMTADSLSLSEANWDGIMDTNLKGAWMVANEAARRLTHAGRPGSIINVSSILGHRVASKVVPYTVSKAGMEQMTRALALEWARFGIRVNALAPGYVETDLNRDFFATPAGEAMIKRIPQRRLGHAGDLDGALLLLASDASLYMTGSSIVVDGGHLQSSL